MSRKTRPYKTWYRINCEVCGKPFVSHRRHARTDTPRCRQRLRRRGFVHCQRDVQVIGRGRHPPPEVAQIAAEPGRGFMPQLHQAAAELPELDYREQAIADGLDPTLFDVRFADGSRARVPADQLEDLEFASATQADAFDQAARDDDYWDVVSACHTIGIVMAPRLPSEYDVARKRVYNLLNSKTRSEADKQAIREAWIRVQRDYRGVGR
jgi:hypothetical protein